MPLMGIGGNHADSDRKVSLCAGRHRFVVFHVARRAAHHASTFPAGTGKIDWSLAWKRIGELIAKVGFFQPVFRFRLGPSILHALIGWGFLIFLVVNLNDLVYGYTGFAS